jgi:hypothetical protein
MDSNLLKLHLKEAVVRIVEDGLKARQIKLEDQIRILLQ